MNPFDDIGQHTRDLLQIAGRPDGVVYNYTPEAEDPDNPEDEWYNDTVESDWSEDSGTQITIMIEYGGLSTTQDESGVDREGDVIITVDPDEAEFSDGTGVDARASEIVDTRDDVRYRVEQRIDDHGGVLTLDASRLEPSA